MLTAYRCFVLAAAELVLACGPTTVRTGPPLALPSGVAQSRCEAAEWLEIAPVQTTATGAKSYGLWATHHTRREHGLAVYSGHDEDLIEPSELWPRIQEPELELRHQARVETIEANQTEALIWALAAVGVMAGGLTYAALAEDASPTARGIAGVGGLVGGLTLTIVAIVRQPSAEEDSYAQVRGRQFVPPEDDPRLLVHGVARESVRTRSRCSGTR